MWVIEWSYPSEYENNSDVFDSELAAYKQACVEIQNHIHDDGNIDLSDRDNLDDAKKFNDLLAKNTLEGYQEAVQFWNNGFNANSDDMAMYWNVSEKQTRILGNIRPPDVKIGITFDWCTKCDSRKIDCDCDEDEDEVSEKEEPFVSTTDGATCRVCFKENEYARADKPDGTYECYGCKSMRQVFTS